MQSTPRVILDRVMQAVEQTVYAEVLAHTQTTRIANDLRIGRFGRLKLALYLEETFGVELPDEVVERFETVGDIVRYLARRSPETPDVPVPGSTGQAWMRA
jgi:acyl carrier protein